MAYEPQPFVATQSGAAGDAPSGARPIALYGAGSGGGVELPINSLDIVITNPQDGSDVTFEEFMMVNFGQLHEIIDDKADDSVTIPLRDPHEEGTYYDTTRSVSEWLGYLYDMINLVNDDLTARAVRVGALANDLEGRVEELEGKVE